MTSQARIDANRENATKSTGPRTAEGKARTRLNAIKHGLRSAEIVLPTEDPAAFDEHIGAWMDDWKPPTMARRALVERTAAAAWRLTRCVRIEKAMLSDRAYDAMDEWDRDREAGIDDLVAGLRDDTRGSLGQLKRMRAGVERLAVLWEAIHDALARPDGWRDHDDHHARLINLQGMSTDSPESADLARASWRLLLGNRPDLVDADSEVPYDAEEAGEVRQYLLGRVAESIARARGYAQTLPDDSAARTRHAEMAALWFRPHDILIQRYEGRLDREFRLNLQGLVALTKSGVDLVEDTSPTEPAPPGPTAPNEPKLEAAEAVDPAIAPNEPNGLEPDRPVAQRDRDRDGRTWPVEAPSAAADRPETDRLDQ